MHDHTIVKKTGMCQQVVQLHVGNDDDDDDGGGGGGGGVRCITMFFICHVSPCIF